MPKVIVATDQGNPVYEFKIAVEDLTTPIARANFFLDLNAALKLAAAEELIEVAEDLYHEQITSGEFFGESL